MGKLLTEKKKREAKLKRQQDKEKKKAIKEAETQVLSFNCVHIHCSGIFGLCKRTESRLFSTFPTFLVEESRHKLTSCDDAGG